jgi:DNA-binding NarL/FixJ family response regulator
MKATVDNRTITILLADDHPIVRSGVRTLLDAEPDFSVIGEAGDGLEAVEQAEKLKPRVLVCDVLMPNLIGIEVVRQVKHRLPRTRIIVFSMSASDAHVLEALRTGAAGYVLKGSDATELITAIRAVARGERYLSADIPARLLDALDNATADAASDPYQSLTAREREVLQLVAEGATNADVAERLFISPRTVEVHRANLMRKLHLKSSAELVRYALSRGIVSLE